MSTGLVERERELASIARFLDAIPVAPSALVIEGEAGIGKTALWSEAVRAAGTLGFRVFQARPVELEAKLSYAALADLLADAFDETRSALPAPQERALAGALLRAEPDSRTDARTTATALVSVLTALASEQPVLVAVDDVQWLDPASARALAFAARRLPPAVGLLLTRRAEPGGAPPLGLAHALPEDRVQRVVPQPLPLAALRRLIADRLATALPRSMLVRVAAASGGNPFFALEIARALTIAAADHEPGDPLPVPPTLQELVLARVRALPSDVQEVLLVAAALARPTAASVAAAAPDVDADAALRLAEEAGVLVAERGQIRFTHPLLASAVYAAACSTRRRQLHRRLAGTVTDPEERARHLGASATEPDERTAAEIERAAVAVAMRGAHEAAADLFESSCKSTPRERTEELARRRLGQADALYELGDVERARSLAASAAAAASAPPLRVRALLTLVRLDWEAGARAGILDRLEHCLKLAAGDPGLEKIVYHELAEASLRFDLPRVRERADAAEKLLTEPGDAQRLAAVHFVRFWADVLRGRQPCPELLERGLELEAISGPNQHIPVLWFMYTDDFDAARARHVREDAVHAERGDDRMRADRLGYRAMLELRAGNWHMAEDFAERGCAILGEFYRGRVRAATFGAQSLVDAHRGRIARARLTVVTLIEEAEGSGTDAAIERLLSILAFIEFAAGDHAAVDRALTEMRERYEGFGAREAVFDRSEPFHVESLLALGELERARETLARLEKRGRIFPRLWIDVALPRARALVLAAEGDVEAALATLDELDVDAAAQLPFELAWAFLVKGRLLRRAKHRRAAADAFGEAHAIFERLGAPDWEDQTTTELARVAPRRRTPHELTPTERRIAELTAAGLTNREVANAAFVSAKTVEVNLTRVYRKLDIRSRAELGARMAGTSGAAETKP